jgi:hypothetical protein
VSSKRNEEHCSRFEKSRGHHDDGQVNAVLEPAMFFGYFAQTVQYLVVKGLPVTGM